ncbi:MAG: hypothetical protein H0Z37_03315 [Firmicutes bacterium]|nr:hypothetical protein [Bacillota bacterium]
MALLAVSLWPLPVLQVVSGQRSDGPAVPLYEAPLLPGASFGVRYLHSIFGAPVEERLRIAPGGFALVEVISTTERIDGYYAFPHGRLEASGGRYRLVPAGDPIVRAPVRMRATALGRRSLVVGGHCVSLAALGDVVELGWRRVPSARWLYSVLRQTLPGKDVLSTCPVPAIAATLTKGSTKAPSPTENNWTSGKSRS